MVRGVKRGDRAQASDKGLLRVTPGDAGKAVVLAAEGEIDLATGPRLRAALAELLERPEPVPVIVDLTDVRFLGSTGIAVLADAHWQACQLGIPLTVVAVPDGPVERTLRACGLHHYLGLHYDLDEALRAVGAKRPDE
jgi:anti-sigma B factor antagonist